MFCFKGIKMNNIIIKFLLTRDRFMPEMHLRQPGFMHSACGLFKAKKQNKKYTKNSKKQEALNISNRINQVRSGFNTYSI